MAKELNAREKRCEDCTECKRKNGIMVCADAWDKPCADIDECTLGIDLEEVETIRAKGEAVKINHEARSATTTERKPRERKIDTEKREIIAKLAETAKKFDNSAEIVNVEQKISFKMNGNAYSITLTKHRPPKK